MSRNMYEQRAAKCVRLAQKTNEALLSFGLMKMAQAWLDLAEKRRPDLGGEMTPRSSAPPTSPRRPTRQTHASAGRAPSRSKGSRKAPAKRAS